MIAVGNYLIVSPSELGNYKIADTPAAQISLRLLDLAAWTVGEHADRAHTDHDLAAGRM